MLKYEHAFFDACLRLIEFMIAVVEMVLVCVV